MITELDLQEAIAECQGERHPNANTAIKLAAFLTIQKELFGHEENRFYSHAAPPEITETPLKTSGQETVGSYGNSDFLNAIKGKDPSKVWIIMDELMDTLSIVNKRVYDSIMRKI